MRDAFSLVGIRPQPKTSPSPQRRWGKIPLLALFVLLFIVLGCVLAPLIATKDPNYLDMANYNHPPDGEFIFGTDNMGRDIFSCIWYGGRISIFIGISSTLISTIFAAIYGAISALSAHWLDKLMMRLLEILLSIPNLLLVIILLAILGKPDVFRISLVIGVTSWFAIAKVVRTEVKQLAGSDFVTAARIMGGDFFYILRRHLMPNIMAAIMFMVVMNVRAAIVYESTLSFMGLGLPLAIISWGSMLSLAEKALLTEAWWIVFLPGTFLVALLLALTAIGNYLQREGNKRESNL